MRKLVFWQAQEECNTPVCLSSFALLYFRDSYRKCLFLLIHLIHWQTNFMTNQTIWPSMFIFNLKSELHLNIQTKLAMLLPSDRIGHESFSNRLPVHSLKSSQFCFLLRSQHDVLL